MNWLSWLGLGFLFSLFSYLVPMIVTTFLPEQNFFQKYMGRCCGAPTVAWALVTGGSRGIGLEISKKLASQGFNVIVLGLPESSEYIQSIIGEIQSQRRNVTAEYIGVDFRDPSLFTSEQKLAEMVSKAVESRDLAMVFLNAGFCLFEDASWASQQQQDMLRVNILANMVIFHALYPKICSRIPAPTCRRRGGVVFTSSCTHFFPDPFGATYAASKAFFAEFALSLGSEARLHHVDVLAISPGFVRGTGFTSTLPRLAILRLLDLVAQRPKQVVGAIWRTLGRGSIYIRDTGAYAWLTRLFIKFFDPWAASLVLETFLPLWPDYQRHIVSRHKPPPCSSHQLPPESE